MEPSSCGNICNTASLVANIVQFVDLGGKIIRCTKEIQSSAYGMTKENKSLEDTVKEMRDLSTDLNPPTTEPPSGHSVVLHKSVMEFRCRSWI